MEFKDRIKSLRRVRAKHLQANSKNWRKHPQSQQAAMQGILAEVGIAGAFTPPCGLTTVVTAGYSQETTGNKSGLHS